VIVVSFSGIDGAGKSTQIAALEELMRRSGFRTRLLTFWDDVVMFSRLREFMSLKAFKGDSGVGSPERPVQRRDKNVSGWPLTLLRFCFYLADTMSLLRVVSRARESSVDVMIFDRYIYDELSNLPCRSATVRFFTRLILKLAPRPDIAYVIDAEPESAYARKPEYPLPFVRLNRQAYLKLAALCGMSVIPPGSIDQTKARIARDILQMLAQSKADLAAKSASSAFQAANISGPKLIEP
jgi:thymidylate kinase